MNYFAFLTVRCILYHDLAFIFSVYHDLPNSFVSYSIIPCFFVSYLMTLLFFCFLHHAMDLLFFCFLHHGLAFLLFFIQYHELLYQHLCSFYCLLCHNLSIKTLLLSFLFFIILLFFGFFTVTFQYQLCWFYFASLSISTYLLFYDPWISFDVLFVSYLLISEINFYALSFVSFL